MTATSRCRSSNPADVSARPEWSPNPYIIGGTVSPNGSFPFAVSIRSAETNSTFCGGALIHRRFILTAAHCVGGFLREIIIGVGSVHLSEQTLVYPEDVYVHEDFNPEDGRFDADIAILKLEEPVTLSPTLQIIDFSYHKDMDNKNVTAMGWGIYTDGDEDERSPVLLHLNRTVISNDECYKLMEPNKQGMLGPRNICINGTEKSGLCFADSGSPLLYVEDGKQYTVGIVSWGVPCAAGFPDVFVRVSPFADWIETTILESLETVV
ncbi:hypothetical protein RUM43_009937 [Polyplax serrata]|uniref:Peptidase S1 domain-containing protein n=1 Tax=Polyplax serrata TaxID=468196 RepID=A0AAN8P3G7_POLSC